MPGEREELTLVVDVDDRPSAKTTVHPLSRTAGVSVPLEEGMLDHRRVRGPQVIPHGLAPPRRVLVVSFCSVGPAARRHQLELGGVLIVIGCAGRVIFGLDVVLDEMQAGAFLSSEAGGLDDLGDQDLRLQKVLQLGNVLGGQLIVAGYGRIGEAQDEGNGREGIVHLDGLIGEGNARVSRGTHRGLKHGCELIHISFHCCIAQWWPRGRISLCTTSGCVDGPRSTRW
jgi:hypothetical protein